MLLREIGTNESHEIAFNFHDDYNNARFCLRNFRSAVPGGVDVVKEVFTVDMGNVSCMASLNVSGNTTLNNATIINSPLNVVADIMGSGTAFTNLNYDIKNL